MYMKSKLITLLTGFFLVGAPAFASLAYVTTPTGLGANDSTSWSSLGGDTTVLGSTFGATSGLGVSVNGAFTGTQGVVAVVCPAAPTCSWGPVSGGMMPGDSLVWAFNSTTTTGTGPITVTFGTSLFGAGFYIDGDTSGPFTAQLAAYNGSTFLGSVGTATSDPLGNPVFLGALDSSAVITKLIVSLTSCAGCNGSGDLGDFAIDTVLMTDVVSATPEPSSVLLLGGGLAAMGWVVRKRSSNSGRKA
jgi:hypothetical protein